MVRSRKTRRAAEDGITQEQLEGLLLQIGTLQDKTRALASKIARHQESLRDIASGAAVTAIIPRPA